MGLRKQLFLVSLTILLLPWAGCQYVQEMEQVLRDNQAQAISEKASVIARMLSPQLPDLSTPNPPFYTALRYQNVQVDGYDDDWQSHHVTALGPHCALQKSLYQDRLYWFLQVRNKPIQYHDPSRQVGASDHVRLLTQQGVGNAPARQWWFYTSAPGQLQAMEKHSTLPYLRPAPAIEAWWSETTQGYNLELGIPSNMLYSHLDIEVLSGGKVVCSSRHKRSASRWLWPRANLAPGLSATLQSLRSHDQDIVVVNPQGWPISEQHNWLHQALDDPAPNNPRSMLGQASARFYRLMVDSLTPSNSQSPWPLKTGELSRFQSRFRLQQLPLNPPKPLVSWYQMGERNQSVLLAVQPLMQDGQLRGYLLLSKTADALVSLTNRALQRVSHLILITFVVVLLVLVLYASLLSWRIRNLKRHLESSLRSDGKLLPFHASASVDEIGDLSRSYQQLLHQIQGYTHYLETLNGKLAHELRTPLAIVKSSLELIQSNPQNPIYLQRAEQGVERLRVILSAMSEASRVEQLIQQSEMKPFDLRGLLSQLQQAYQDTYGDHQFELHSDLDSAMVEGNPELIAQLVDKLVDNARSFAPTQSCIQFHLQRAEQHHLIKIRNSGPPLPAELEPQLFDSLVSQRQDQSQSDPVPHLGLGLFIVRLICQAHGGSVSAHNMPQHSGVEFVISLPAYP